MSASKPKAASEARQSSVEADLGPVRRFLSVATPDSWLDVALAELPTLLADHANCERKAANTALALIARYPERTGMLQQLSRLAREEMRHFEQVVALMKERGIVYQRVSASRYAAGLMAGVRAGQVERLVDTLIVGAVVEARSCERFAALVDVLGTIDAELAVFYRRLLASEARHFEVYLDLARTACSSPASLASIDERIAHFTAVDAELICSPDTQFRFHSGVPASAKHCNS